VADIIQLRRDTASAWTSTNPTLASGELGLETDTGKLKIGDASTAWTSLAYYTLATTGYAPLASPTFTGAVNASGTLQIAGTTITSTATELNILDGVTADKDELNILDGVTADKDELNILDGVTADKDELNILDGVTADKDELNILDGVTADKDELNVLDGIPAGLTATELGYVDGVTSSIQTQIDTKGTVSNLSDLSITSTATELNVLDALSRGSILYGNASGATTVLTKGTVDQLLTSDGTDIAWEDPAPSSTTVTDSTANVNFPVVFHNESNLLFDDTGALRYNPSTGELLVPKLTVAGTTTTADTVTMNAQNAIIFEGATADAYETTLTIADPTADHTQVLINQGGYIPVLATSTTTAITSTPAELNVLDGIPAGLTATELGYVDGVTSSIQNQIDATAAAAGSMSNVVEDVTPQLGGDLDVNGKDLVSTSNGSIDLNPHGSGTVNFSGNVTRGSGQFKMYCANNTHSITIKGPPHSAGANYTLTLPDDDGIADQALKTDGSGTLSWAEVGYKNIPQNLQNAAYTLVLADSGKHIHHAATDGTARTWTIPANSSVAYPIGTAITFTNLSTADVTIAITSDSLYHSTDQTAGSRTLAQYGMATALKVYATKWVISGNGLT